MKKLVLISTVIASLAGFSAFGQGYFQFTTAKSQVWDGFSTGVAHTAAVNTAFLWAAAPGTTPTVESIVAGVPTTATSANTTWTAASAWTAILNDPNFQLAVNSGSGNSLAIQLSTTAGAISYNAGNAFAGPTATAPGSIYSLYMIAWSSAYATPALAAAANGGLGSYVGWSSAFDYTATASTSVPNSFAVRAPNFGTGGIIPEPATMALAGLGGLMLLALRRRK